MVALLTGSRYYGHNDLSVVVNPPPPILCACARAQFQHQTIVEGLSKESIIGAWKVKFDKICRGGERPCELAMKLAVPQAELVTPSKEQLYELLMRTLGVEKYEHQVLYNACQVSLCCVADVCADKGVADVTSMHCQLFFGAKDLMVV